MLQFLLGCTDFASKQESFVYSCFVFIWDSFLYGPLNHVGGPSRIFLFFTPDSFILLFHSVSAVLLFLASAKSIISHINYYVYDANLFGFNTSKTNNKEISRLCLCFLSIVVSICRVCIIIIALVFLDHGLCKRLEQIYSGTAITIDTRYAR